MKNIRRNFVRIMLVVALFIFTTPSSFAHVVVRPNQAGVAAFQTFTVGVPNEKELPTIALRLVIPAGLNYVTPNVKPGWNIEVVKEGEGDNARITEINWTGGSIPSGQRDDFLFSAQVPAEEATIIWKAYQTYEDNTVVAWDGDPTAEGDHNEESEEAEKPGPYSTTEVVNDLAGNKEESTIEKDTDSKTALYLSVFAVLLGGGALWMQMRRK